MTLSEFRTFVRLYVPSAKTAKIGNSTLDTLINAGVDDVNAHAMAYQGNEKIDVEADTDEYLFSTEIPDFLCIDESGIWWNDGTADTTEWKKLDPMKRRVLDDQYPRWRDDASSDPLRYIIENDTVLFHPTPGTDLTDGFWVFYAKKAVSMTAGTHYPFTGSTKEISALSVLDDAIIDYVRWKLSRPLGSNQKGIISEQDYQKNLAVRVSLLRRRLDITASPMNRMRGPTIGR